jgi:hypothetical protein
VILYGCETWSLTLREEHGLRVFENRVLRRIFGSKGDEVTGNQRKLHTEQLHKLHSSPNVIRTIKIRSMRWAGHVARMAIRGIQVGFWWGRRKKIDDQKDLDAGGKIILIWILER